MKIDAIAVANAQIAGSPAYITAYYYVEKANDDARKFNNLYRYY